MSEPKYLNVTPIMPIEPYYSKEQFDYLVGEHNNGKFSIPVIDYGLENGYHQIAIVEEISLPLLDRYTNQVFNVEYDAGCRLSVLPEQLSYNPKYVLLHKQELEKEKERRLKEEQDKVSKEIEHLQNDYTLMERQRIYQFLLREQVEHEVRQESKLIGVQLSDDKVDDLVTIHLSSNIRYVRDEPYWDRYRAEVAEQKAEAHRIYKEQNEGPVYGESMTRPSVWDNY